MVGPLLVRFGRFGGLVVVGSVRHDFGGSPPLPRYDTTVHIDLAQRGYPA